MVMSEPDWKAFKKVRSTALDRFCRRALDLCAKGHAGDRRESSSSRSRGREPQLHKPHVTPEEVRLLGGSLSIEDNVEVLTERLGQGQQSSDFHVRLARLKPCEWD